MKYSSLFGKQCQVGAVAVEYLLTSAFVASVVFLFFSTESSDIFTKILTSVFGKVMTLAGS